MYVVCIYIYVCLGLQYRGATHTYIGSASTQPNTTITSNRTCVALVARALPLRTYGSYSKRKKFGEIFFSFYSCCVRLSVCCACCVLAAAACCRYLRRRRRRHHHHHHCLRCCRSKRSENFRLGLVRMFFLEFTKYMCGVDISESTYIGDELVPWVYFFNNFS